MKNIIYIFAVVLFAFVACNSTKEAAAFNPDNYDNFGEAFEVADLITNEQAAETFAKLNAGDSVQIQFQAPINEVCTKKGCWMNLDLGNEDVSFVKFKDYGFFVPKDAAGREAIVKGWAHKRVTPVSELQHYAEDAGKSPEEIAAITEPKVDYFFMADGVWMTKVEEEKEL